MSCRNVALGPGNKCTYTARADDRGAAKHLNAAHAYRCKHQTFHLSPLNVAHSYRRTFNFHLLNDAHAHRASIRPFNFHLLTFSQQNRYMAEASGEHGENSHSEANEKPVGESNLSMSLHLGCCRCT